ncbi:MAG: tetratricopeptide repeat protein [Balneolales bacterium]
MFKIFSLTFLIVSFAAISTLAQEGNGFMIANELLNEGEYEEAYEILERLLKENPDSYPVFDRTVTALVNLKRYDEAIQLSEDRLNGDYSDVVAAANLGELHHSAGDTAKAIEVWHKTLDFNSGNLQTYRHIARTMNQRREYKHANRLYFKARAKQGQPGLFANEIANNWLVTGHYEEAMQEYLNLIAANGDFSFQVQRQLMRFDEQYLFDIAILETEDKISDYRSDSQEAASFREFLIWLYMERGLHSRALSTAHALESSSTETRYAVFELGDRLRVHNEFELAESAYSYYVNQSRHELKARSLEQIALVYMTWAGYLEDNNLDYHKKDSLYEKANLSLNELSENFPRYVRRSNALLLQTELALDYLKDIEQAKLHHNKLQALPQDDDLEPQVDYLEGRIHLLSKDFNQARIAFTQSNRTARIGNLADKAKYYLALTDFYSGDYDFAQIQLRALERQNTSFFANNALQLRLWIQEGVNPDSTTTELDAFSEARYYYDVAGKTDQALKTLSPLLDESQNHPLRGEAVLLASSILRGQNGHAAFNLVNINIENGLNPASMERIFWARARLADYIYFEEASGNFTEQEHLPEYLGPDNSSEMIDSVNEVIETYEDLLIQYPQGYYAEKARERIQKLSSVTN